MPQILEQEHVRSESRALISGLQLNSIVVLWNPSPKIQGTALSPRRGHMKTLFKKAPSASSCRTQESASTSHVGSHSKGGLLALLGLAAILAITPAAMADSYVFSFS